MEIYGVGMSFNPIWSKVFDYHLHEFFIILLDISYFSSSKCCIQAQAPKKQTLILWGLLASQYVDGNFSYNAFYKQTKMVILEITYLTVLTNILTLSNYAFPGLSFSGSDFLLYHVRLYIKVCKQRSTTYLCFLDHYFENCNLRIAQNQMGHCTILSSLVVIRIITCNIYL